MNRSIPLLLSLVLVAACSGSSAERAEDTAGSGLSDVPLNDAQDVDLSDTSGTDPSEDTADTGLPDGSVGDADTPPDPDSGADADNDSGSDAPTDLRPDTTPDVMPDSADVATDGPPLDTESTPPSVGDFTTARGADSARAFGEVVAIYDHSLWWSSPSDERTFALYDDSRFSTLLSEDHSFDFVRETEVTRFEPADAGGRRTYRDALRSRAITLEEAPLANRFFVIASNDTYHLEENGFGDFAWDLVRTSEDGRTFRRSGFTNADYFVWGAPVRLPSGGVVVEVQDFYEDNVPGTMAPLSEESSCGANNCIGVHLGGSFYLYLLHLRQGSIPDGIRVGDALEAGELVGEVGNSGVSLAPHLHVAMLWFDESADPPRSWSVPMEIENIWWSTATSGATRADYLNPAASTWLSSEAF